MKENLTPFEIQFLLHCYYSPNPWPDSNARQDAIDRFEAEALLFFYANTSDGPVYRLTPRGKALVQMLCATPFPVESWADPREARR